MAIHVVRSGESLWTIANYYGISIPSIVRDNGIIDIHSIVPGLALYIANHKFPFYNRSYQIKAGDTLWALARRFRTSVEQIIQTNQGIDINRLMIGKIILIPSPNKLSLTTLGFIEPYNPEEFLSTLNLLANQLTFIGLAAFSLTEEGYAFVALRDQEIVARSKQLNITPLLMIRNFENGVFSPEKIDSILVNPTYRNNLITSLVGLVRSRGYEGVSIDFEFMPPERRNEFTLFLRDLKTALGESILHVNVHAKTEDNPAALLSGPFDYREIGRIADIVAVMTHDYGYPAGPPDPVAPIWWVNNVLRYALTQISANKLQMALPLYGYDKKVPTNQTSALSVLAAQNKAISKGSPILFDQRAQSPWYQYWEDNQQHIVWFEDIRSYIEKYNLMDQYQLLGTTFWQLSLPAPQNWAFLRDNIAVQKR